MNRTTIIVAIGLALAAALASAPAQAQLQHTFVSSTGSDANSCSLAAPCRHLQTALTNTLAGGEINILDSAGYNGGTTVTISQAVSIVAPLGIEAELAPPSGGAAIVINAGASDAVSLRGLSIDGGGVSNTTGIQFNTGKSLTVENCVVRHVTKDGMDFFPNGTSSLTVSDSLLADNDDAGIAVYPSGSGTVAAVFNHVQAKNNASYGIFVWGANSIGTINATVYESVATNNGKGFYFSSPDSHAITSVMVFHSVAANNGYGIYTTGPALIVGLAFSAVTGNATGWYADSGSLRSYGNNTIDFNTDGGIPPPTAPLK